MNLYLISQDVNVYYDSYDSAVVAAENSEDAAQIHPSGHWKWKMDGWHFVYIDERETEPQTPDDWATIADIHVALLGKANANIKRGVILASFNAG